MGPEAQDATRPAGQSQAPALPFAEVSEALRLIQQRTPYGAVFAAELESLIGVVNSLETAYAWAAEMQLGAEGFDNTASARAYSEIQVHLVNAARDIGKVCDILRQQSNE